MAHYSWSGFLEILTRDAVAYWRWSGLMEMRGSLEIKVLIGYGLAHWRCLAHEWLIGDAWLMRGSLEMLGS